MRSKNCTAYIKSIFLGMKKCDYCGADENSPCMNDDDQPMLCPCDESTTRNMTLRIYERFERGRFIYSIIKQVKGRNLKFFQTSNKESAEIELKKIEKLVKEYGFELAFEFYREMRKNVKAKHTTGPSLTTTSRKSK